MVEALSFGLSRRGAAGYTSLESHTPRTFDKKLFFLESLMFLRYVGVPETLKTYIYIYI